MDERQPRKLAVILHADVVGSTRLVQRNETLAHERIQNVFHRFSESIRLYGGITHELRGDALLAEFERASDAVCAALAFQAENAEFNSTLDDDIQPRLRIGISMGEVVIADNTVTGAGVVLAQRLEQLAEPGGACIQGAAYETVPQRLPFDYENLGEQVVKGFGEPVRAYTVTLKLGELVPAPEPHKQPKRGWIAGGVIAFLVIFVGGLAWWQPWVEKREPASIGRMAFPLPKEPSIAVLPFANISGDPEQEYFADGMTGDLITDLSRISGLFVIARNSSFYYKGQKIKVRQVAEELGVRYVLEGSVRRAGDQVRINAQLIDATTGGHLWANRFDRDIDDIFKLQDEVVSNIVSALAVKLTDKEKVSRKSREQSGSMQAHEYFLRGRQHLERFTAKDTAKAKELFENAVELDPKHAQALTALGLLHYNEWQIWGKARDKNLARALELGQKAVAVDDTLAGPHLLLSQVYRFLREQEQSEVELNKALALEPRDADTLAGLGDVLRWTGRPQEAIESLQTAMRLDPFYPAWYEHYLGDALFQMGRYEEAITALTRGAERNPNYPAFPLFIAASYAMLGQEEEARAAAAEVLRINPRFTLKAYAAHVPYFSREDLERDLTAFRKAGLPE